MPRITIIGLGCIGRSLGLALRQAKVGYEIVGHDRDYQIAGEARKGGAIDRAEWNLPAALREAGLVIVAVPVHALQSVFQEAAPHLERGCVVTDTATVKQQVLAWAQEHFPAEVSFVGGDPVLTLTDRHGEATPELFRGSIYCLTPSLSADSQAIDLMVGLATIVGARPHFLEAAEHDSFAAALRHLPALANSALVKTVLDDPARADILELGRPESNHRLISGAGDALEFSAIAANNRETLLRWLDGYRHELDSLRRVIADQANGEGELRAVLEQVYKSSSRIRAESPGADKSAVLGPTDRFRQLLLGRLGSRRK